MKIEGNKLVRVEPNDIVKGIFNVPEGIKIIGAYAFEDLMELKCVNMPDSVEVLSSGAFCSCKNLKKVNLSNKIAKIEAVTFLECQNLKRIVIPENVIYIGINAFSKCTSLKKIILPEKLELIGDFVFSNCTSLKKIKLPNSVKKLGDGVFLECTSLQNIFLPDSILEIGDRCFCECENLKQIKLPENLKKINEKLFSNCSSLKKIFLPDNIEQIDDNAFFKCEKLFYLDLPKNLKKFGKSVFNESGLYNITIPEKVDFINCENFSFCYNLEKIKIDGEYCKIMSNGKVIELKSSLQCFIDMYVSDFPKIIIGDKHFNLIKNNLEFLLFRKKELLDKIYIKLKENNHIYNIKREDLDKFYETNNNFKNIIDFILENLDDEKYDYRKYVDVFDSLFPNTRFSNLPSVDIFIHLNIDLAKSYNYKIMREILKLEILKNEQAYIPNVVSLFGLFENDKYVYNRLNLMKKIFGIKLIFDEDDKYNLDPMGIHEDYFDIFEEEIYTTDTKIPDEFNCYLRTKMTKEEMKSVRKLNKNFGKKINDFVKENYKLISEKYYVIKDSIDADEITPLILESNVKNQFTYKILYELFSSSVFKYDEKALNLFINSYKLILKDKILQQKFNILLRNFKEYEQYYLLKGENYLNIYDAVNYVENEHIGFDNINAGNYEFAILAKNAGIIHQSIFEQYQLLYEKMKKRRKSYIPRIYLNEKININNKSYNILMEILRTDDPIGLFVGEQNYTNCCQKLHAIGASCVEHIAEKGKIFATYLIDENNNKILLTESWVWRRNNVICFDNIEGTNYGASLKYFNDIINYVYKRASLEIINVCKNNNDKVDVVAIGENHNCVSLEKYFGSSFENPVFPKDNVGYTDSDKIYFVIGDKGLIDTSVEEKEIYLDERVVENKDCNLITTKNVNDIVKIGKMEGNILYTKDLAKYYNLSLEDLNVYLGTDWYFVYSIIDNRIIIHDFKSIETLFNEDMLQNEEIKNSLNLLFDLKSDITITNLNVDELTKIINILDDKIDYEILCLGINQNINSNELMDNYTYKLILKQKNKIFNYKQKSDKMM